MRLLLVRHAIAAESSGAGGDRARPLTAEGRTKMSAGARGLRVLVPELRLIGSSPLLRAAETAELLSAAYGGVAVEMVEALAPAGDRREVLAWLLRCWRAEPATTIAAVGHQPVLGELGSWLLAAASSSFVELKKGGAALLDFGDAEPQAGGAWLRWLAEPAHLRLVAKSAPER